MQDNEHVLNLQSPYPSPGTLPRSPCPGAAAGQKDHIPASVPAAPTLPPAPEVSAATEAPLRLRQLQRALPFTRAGYWEEQKPTLTCDAWGAAAPSERWESKASVSTPELVRFLAKQASPPFCQVLGGCLSPRFWKRVWLLSVCSVPCLLPVSDHTDLTEPRISK